MIFMVNEDKYTIPWEPTTFIFRGYNPYLGGVKPAFFMVLGSKGIWILWAMACSSSRNENLCMMFKHSLSRMIMLVENHVHVQGGDRIPMGTIASLRHMGNPN